MRPVLLLQKPDKDVTRQENDKYSHMNVDTEKSQQNINKLN